MFRLLVVYILVPFAFSELGVIGGASYQFAMFFRMVRIGRADYIPLPLVALIAIMVGLIGSSAIRPLIGDAKDVALAQDFIGALIILGVFTFMTLWFRRWQSGNPL